MIPQLNRHHLAYAALPFALLLGGCFHEGLFGGGTEEAVKPAGVYKSVDRGETWATANLVLTTDAVNRPTLNDTSVQAFVMDPTDRQALYLGSRGQGLFYTYDSARRWWQSGPIRTGTITDVAIPHQPALRCTLYAATANRILKTTDCGRFWEQPYFDTRTDSTVLSVAVHRENPATIFAGTSKGDVLRSEDGAVSWETVARLGGPVSALRTHELNPDLVYAVVDKKGLWKTVDSGATWTEASEGLREFSGAAAIASMALDPLRPETVITASKYGLVVTTDGGESWAPLRLLTPPGQVDIVSVALNPADAKDIYYTTTTTLYRSTDAGETWETRPLPVGNVRTKLIVDPKAEATLYLGVARPQQQQSRGFGF